MIDKSDVQRDKRNRCTYAHYCETCEEKRYLKLSDAKKTSCCSRCQRRAAGKLGYKVTYKRYGMRKIIAKLGEWRRNQPMPATEQVINDLLESWGWVFTWEKELKSRKKAYLCDFWVYEPHELVIEVNSPYYHSSPQRKRADLGKKLTLKHREIPLLVISTSDLDRASEIIKEFVCPKKLGN